MSNLTKTNYDVGVAGSITMIALTVAVVILLRSFYKRFTNVRKRRSEVNEKGLAVASKLPY
jgi:hypothetical protein